MKLMKLMLFMETLGTERTTISLNKEIDVISKTYATDKGLKFSTVVDFALKHFLSAEGYLGNRQSLTDSEILKISREATAAGINIKELFEKAIRGDAI